MKKPKFKEIIAKQKAHGESVREWLHEKELEAARQVRIDRIERLSSPRGVNRVPAHLWVNIPEPVFLVEHFDTPRSQRRRQARVVRDARGHATRHMRPGTNTPYVSPERAEKKARAKARSGR